MLPLEMEKWRSQLFCGEGVDERRGKGPGAHGPEGAEGARACEELYSSRRDINNAPLENKGNQSVLGIELDDREGCSRTTAKSGTVRDFFFFFSDFLYFSSE